MKERFEIWFKSITTITNLIKIGGSVIAVGIFTIGMVAKHDAKIIRQFNEQNTQVSYEKKVDVLIKNDSVTRVWRHNFDSTYKADKIEAVNLGWEIKHNLIVIDTALETHLRISKEWNQDIQFIKNLEKKNSMLNQTQQNLNITSDTKR
jgi:hypothetical protein